MARLTRVEQQQQTRALLLEAAERMFVAQGFHATSVDEIAEEAGFSKGAVYSNFGSKDELFLALLERRTDHLLGLEAGIDSSRSITTQATSAGAAFADAALEDTGWSMVFMEFATYAARQPELRERFADRNRRELAGMVPLIDAHLDALGLQAPMPTEDLAAILFVLGNGFLLERLIDPEAFPSSLFGQALVLLMSALAPTVETARTPAPPKTNRRPARAERSHAMGDVHPS